MPLLAHGREVAANAAKSGGPVRTAKGARNLLLDLGHTKISFSKIVRKWERKIIEQSEHLFGTGKQSIEQILGLALFGLALAFWGSRRWRLGGIAKSEDFK